MPERAAAPEADGGWGHRGTRAIQRMVEYAPSTGGLALWVKHHDLPADLEAPAIATDGNTVHYGAVFEHRALSEQIGLVAHEVLHIALRHPQRFLELKELLGDVDLPLFNICADAIINSTLAHLSWLTLPKGAVMLDELLAESLDITVSAETALLEWDVERLYRAIDDRGPLGEGGKGSGGDQRQGTELNDNPSETARPWMRVPRPATREDGPRSGCTRRLGRDAIQDLVPDPEQQGPPEAEADEAREWSERLIRAHAGDGAFSMLRVLLADLPRTHTPWEQVLRTQLARGLARKPDVSWSRPARSYIANQGRGGPNRRLPWEPGFTTAKRVPWLALVVDVSGSIEDGLMERFAREIEAITRRLEVGLVLIIGDMKVRRVEHHEPGRSTLRGLAFQGGGGTDFTPLLEEADRHHPDIAVVLTDLDGPARFRPGFPVIWAVPEAPVPPVAPFGRVLLLS